MPLYDYRCHKCGEVFEVRQKFSDELLTAHEGCGGELERLISAPAFQFKGTGWYVTDYARGGSGGSGNGKSDKSEGKSDGKSDAPAKSAESKTESKSSSAKPPADSGSKS